MFHITNIDHVQLAAPVGCEDTARKFFGELLGMNEIEKSEQLRSRGGVWFEVGSQQLHVGVEQDFSPAKKAHPAFHVINLKALRTHVMSKGVAVKDDPLPGADRIFIEDPFGNRIEFTERY